ncbi:MAG: GntG family PLP-dependent aldolase, partial [Anaerolineales bacterium]
AHLPPTRLITLENTLNRCGGAALSVAYTQQIGELAQEHNLILHLDGARIFNAAAALNVDPADLVAPVDSVTFCLSKGLSAPVGSVICGNAEFIRKAHRIRKQLGGGMRQAGILAAAGIVALETIVPRMREDHRRAQALASGLAAIPGVKLDPGTPQTNMVYLTLGNVVPMNASDVALHLKEKDILVGVVGARRFRLVTHFWIDEPAVSQAVEGFREVLKTEA